VGQTMTDPIANDRYVVERTVFERESVLRQVAVDRLLGREVLVTRLRGRAGRTAAVQLQFRTGAERAARLNHQHIVAMFDLETENGLPFCVQEFSSSESLREIIDHEGPFHPDDVAALIEQIAGALDYGNQRSIAHGAVRPDSIIVDYDGTALLTDFGIGQVLDSIEPDEMSSLYYRSPESLDSGEANALADIYALGVIAYEMLTDNVPFDAPNVEELKQRIRAGYPDAPSQVNTEVPPALSGLVLSALSRNPGERYLYASDFSEALKNWREAQVDPRLHPSAMLQMPGFVPAASPVDDSDDVNAPTDADDDSALGNHSHLTAILAWVAVAIGLGAIIWIGISVWDARNDDGRPPITRIAGETIVSTPTAGASIAATSSSAPLPTAISLIGMTVSDATGKTTISVRQVATETSASVPDGQIIRQSPNPGEPIRNNEIVVVVSGGSGPIQLGSIDVVDKPLDTVAKQLTDLGLNVVPVDEGSASVAAGNVIRIEEQSAQAGDDVHLVVSKGDQVQIPLNLQSMPVDDAVAMLEDLGLVVKDPLGVSRSRIEESIDLDAYKIVDGDVVGIQEADAGFGSWVDVGSTVTPVFYNSDLDP
jgi:eukaryotic-like serine/threonine-protein kinase